MSALQWALLILGGAVVIAVYVISRREKQTLKNWTPPPVGGQANAKLPAAEQAELFSKGQFDEFGVGKPRKRTAPTMHATPQKPLFTEPKPAPETAATPTPVFVRAKPQAEPQPEPAPMKAEEKIIALLIAEREGTAIFGSKLHAALQQQKLQFGAKQIYHRMEQGMVVFSVASLLKPGTLEPAEAQRFSTPGLSVFMVLPGPVKPVTAFQDMVSTARALAKSLNAEVFDSRRQPFTADSERAQRAEVEAWARANHLA